MKHRHANSPRRRKERTRVQLLCNWFRENARDLPWRRKRTGYTALVAEAILQQTQVSRVMKPYQSFLRRFPTIRALASADEQDVLAAWQGMGYYTRARCLHRAANMIVKEFGGRVPGSVEKLRRLPGVGRYTAGAIASIVHGRPEPIVDGNVERVLARWFARSGAGSPRERNNWAWRTAARLVKSAKKPGVFNEALMELGATVCLPRSPRCDACPVSSGCEARRRGLQDDIPEARRRAKPRAAHHHVLLVKRRGRVLVERRATNGMWAGMWQAPTIESDRPLSTTEIKQSRPLQVYDLIRRGGFVHRTTHRRITFHVYRAFTRMRGGNWMASESLPQFPMSNAQRKVLTYLDDGE